MNLLELQVLAVVSGIPDANDARFMFEPAPLDPDPGGAVSKTDPVHAAPDDVSAKRPA